MKQYTTPVIRTLFACAVWLVIFLFGRYNLYTYEQFQLFQMDWHYIGTNITEIGGFTTMLSEFVIQFYHIPWLGTTLMTLIILAAIYTLRHLLLKITGEANGILILAIIPIIPFVKSVVLNDGLSDSGDTTMPTLAYIITLLTTSAIINCNKFRWLATAIVIIPLYWLVGPVAMLMIISIPLISILQRRGINNTLKELLPIAIYAICGYLAIRTNIIGNAENLISSKFYIPTYRIENNYILSAWILTLCTIAIYPFINKIAKDITGEWLTHTIGVLGIAGTAFIIYSNINTDYYKQYSQIQKLNYLYTNEKYQEILDIYSTKKPEDLLQRNYISMALLKTDKLTSDFFKYDPIGHLSILTKWYDACFPIPFIWSEVTLKMGFIAKTQQTAFEGNMLAGPRGAAPFIKQLAEVEIIRGNYKTAEKYINELENAPFYKTWAKEQRKFLFNEKAIQENDYYRLKRKCLIPDKRVLAQIDELSLMIDIAKRNPLHKSTTDIAGIMTLSAGNIPAFRAFISELYNTPALRELPKVFQEGIVIAYENYPIFWRAYKIPTKLGDDFKDFAKYVMERDNNPVIANAGMNKYKYTLWLYLADLREKTKKAQMLNNANTTAPSSEERPNN